MKKILRKSAVLREGYVKGLREAQRIIAEQMEEATGGYVGKYTATVDRCYIDGWDAATQSRHEDSDDFEKFDGAVLHFDDASDLFSEVSELVGIPELEIEIYPDDSYDGAAYATFKGDEEGNYTTEPDHIFDLAFTISLDGEDLSYEEVTELLMGEEF